MKKCVLLSFVFFLTLINCADEECYSCDSEIDAWVKKNATELKEMSRAELSKLKIPYQRAALRMFSPERKKKLWTEKINLVKSLNFTKLEREHLKFMEKELKNLSFKEPMSEDKEQELLNWAEEGKEQFKWTDEFLVKAFFLIGDFNFTKSEGLIEFGDPAGNTGDNCNCRYHIGCGGPDFYCTNEDCEETDDGCGFFGDSSCTGICL